MTFLQIRTNLQRNSLLPEFRKEAVENAIDVRGYFTTVTVCGSLENGPEMTR